MEEAILEVKNLKTYFYNDGKELRASDDLSYQVHKGECVAIIGESGSGKTVEALSILRLIPLSSRIDRRWSDSISWTGSAADVRPGDATDSGQ